MSSHLVRKHFDFDFAQAGTATQQPRVPGSAAPRSDEGAPDDVAPDYDHDGVEEEPTSNDRGHLLASKSSALLLLCLKERHRLTQSAVNFSICQIKQMMARVLDDVKASVKHRVGEIDIEDCFDVDPFEGLGSEYLQTKFYREHFDLVVSCFGWTRYFGWTHFHLSTSSLTWVLQVMLAIVSTKN